MKRFSLFFSESSLAPRFQLVDHDQDGAVVEGEFLRLLPEDSLAAQVLLRSPVWACLG